MCVPSVEDVFSLGGLCGFSREDRETSTSCSSSRIKDCSTVPCMYAADAVQENPEPQSNQHSDDRQDGPQVADGNKEDAPQAEKDANRRVPRKRKAKRGTSQVIMDYEQMIIPGPTYQSWIQGASDLHIKPMSNMKITHLMELPPVGLTCRLSGYGSKEVYYPVPLINLWMKYSQLQPPYDSPSGEALEAFPVPRTTRGNKTKGLMVGQRYDMHGMEPVAPKDTEIFRFLVDVNKSSLECDWAGTNWKANLTNNDFGGPFKTFQFDIDGSDKVCFVHGLDDLKEKYISYTSCIDKHGVEDEVLDLKHND
ncbi:hypothetical protein GIB67_035537 [Kingdonia uniflora]|uniref:Uncharacterized protein n=1 Tax=Kingdonia uniflora TaxID=39325 RepID=A0A7J7MC74_9MAGN|nr:hypothetical protein GIB67_035537 [Kingdonia uniflora]